MGKNVMLSDDAYAILLKHKETEESFSDVVRGFIPPPIRTFGDLEKHLKNLEGPLNLDFEVLARIRERKQKGNRAH